MFYNFLITFFFILMSGYYDPYMPSSIFRCCQYDDINWGNLIGSIKYQSFSLVDSIKDIEKDASYSAWFN